MVSRTNIDAASPHIVFQVSFSAFLSFNIDQVHAAMSASALCWIYSNIVLLQRAGTVHSPKRTLRSNATALHLQGTARYIIFATRSTPWSCQTDEGNMGSHGGAACSLIRRCKDILVQILFNQPRLNIEIFSTFVACHHPDGALHLTFQVFEAVLAQFLHKISVLSVSFSVMVGNPADLYGLFTYRADFHDLKELYCTKRPRLS